MTGRADIVIVGAGRMGRGLAHVFAYAGHPVTLIDLKERTPEEARQIVWYVLDDIRHSLNAIIAYGAMPDSALNTVLGRIGMRARDRAAEALAAADIVLEAVPETLDAKRDALAFVSAHARADAIVASTTSTIMVEELAAMMTGPERFLNAHWLNPAFLIPLVEVSPGKATAPDVVDRVKALLDSVGKVPVVCAPSPGYIVPRLQALVMNEAARLVEEGVATAEEVDRATRFGLGFRFATIGVVEFIDWGGGDILYRADEYLSRALGTDRFAAPESVKRNMETGAIGLKTGRGFHDYGERDVFAYQGETLQRFLALLDHYGLLPPPADGGG